MDEKPLTIKQELGYVGIGFLIAIVYTIWLVALTDDYEGFLGIFIIPEAHAQILPFEQQLEQIREPKECTRKVVQGKSAVIPFSMKIFYDTSRDSKLEFKQQGTTFPLVQRTNQVMTFYTNGTDQYQIYVEVNYEQAKPRQIYIEYLSENQIVQSLQEKFNTKRFCMTLFVNTILPERVLTKEEIFGESLDFIGQIPAMVTAFNANTITTGTSISYMWMLMFGVLVVAVLTFISSQTGKRRFDSKIRDLDDSIQQVNEMTLTMDGLVREVKEPLIEIKKDLKSILGLPQIKDIIPEKKESTFKKIIHFGKKKEKKKEYTEAEITKQVEEEAKQLYEGSQKQQSDQVIEELKSQPSGGFIVPEKEEKVLPPTPPSPKEENPMKSRPNDFLKILKSIDFRLKQFKEGEFDNFTYNQLNESYGWIVRYRKWAQQNRTDIPEEFLNKQEVAEKVIYYAIFAKMNRKMKD